MTTPSAGGTFDLTNAISAEIASATKTSQASFGIGANLDAKKIPGSGTISGLYDPYARASYSQQGPNSTLSFDAAFNQTDLDASRAAYDSGGGDLRTTDLGGSFSFGQDAPLGGSFGARRETSDYVANTNPLNFDDETQSWNASLDVAVTRKLRIGPSISRVDFSVADLTSTRTVTTALGVNATAEISEVLTVTAQVSRDEIARTVLGTTTTTSSPGWGVTASVLTATGSQSLDFSQELSTGGTRNSLFYDREFELPNLTGNAGIGLTKTAAGESIVIASLNLDRALSNGNLSAGLTRTVSTSAGGAGDVDTDMNTKLTYDLANGSGISFAFALGQSYDAAVGPLGSDGSLKATYDLNVTEDWALVAGVEHRFDDDGAGTIARSNSIFVTLSRSWIRAR